MSVRIWKPLEFGTMDHQALRLTKPGMIRILCGPPCSRKAHAEQSFGAAATLDCSRDTRTAVIKRVLTRLKSSCGQSTLVDQPHSAATLRPQLELNQMVVALMDCMPEGGLMQ